MEETSAEARARVDRVEQRMKDADALRRTASGRGGRAPAKRVYPSYGAALEAGQRIGARRADDAALMALFCAGPLQTLVGAVSPELVWQGAQTKELTTRQLAAMANRDVMEVDALQWI